MKTDKINTLSPAHLDEMMTDLIATVNHFEDQFDFNILASLEHKRGVSEGDFKDWRDTAREIEHLLTVLMAETQSET